MMVEGGVTLCPLCVKSITKNLHGGLNEKKTINRRLQPPSPAKIWLKHSNTSTLNPSHSKPECGSLDGTSWHVLTCNASTRITIF